MAFDRTTKDEHTFKTLGDTPSAITASNYVRGNTGGTDLEFRAAADVRSDIGAGTGTMSDFTLAGDSGTNQTIADGNTLTVAGGDGITTAGGAADSDEVIVTLDLTKDQAWTGSQRGTFPTAVTDGTIDMGAANNFLYNPAASPDELGFTNITNGQSGYIILDNTDTDTITLAGHVKSPGGTGATDLSATGTHLINYVTDGTTVYITYGKAMA